MIICLRLLRIDLMSIFALPAGMCELFRVISEYNWLHLLTEHNLYLVIINKTILTQYSSDRQHPAFRPSGTHSFLGHSRSTTKLTPLIPRPLHFPCPEWAWSETIYNKLFFNNLPLFSFLTIFCLSSVAAHNCSI